MQEYLKETPFLDFNDPVYDAFLDDIDTNYSNKELAIALYYKVRDSFLYDPYHLNITEDGLRGSNIILKKRAWCVEKAIVLASLARKYGIPSRLGYAIVTNHIGVEKLIEYLKRPEIVFHGYVELFIDDKWIKCTPSFDKRICKVSRVSTLEWDGQNDSMFQEYDKGKRFMDYILYYGEFSDVPLQLMNNEMRKYYPHLFETDYNSKAFSFIHS